MTAAAARWRLARWVRSLRLSAAAADGLAAAAAVAAATAVGARGATGGPPAVEIVLAVALAVAAVAVAASLGLRRIDAAVVARHLDRAFPELEDSAGLVLSEAAELPGLARLQRRRVAARFDDLPRHGRLPRRSWRRAALAAALGAVALGGLASAPRSAADAATGPGEPLAAPPAPGIAALEIEIRPPAYTGAEPRWVASWSFRAEEGAAVSWSIVPRTPIESAVLHLDGGETLRLEPGAGGVWRGGLTVSRSRLYAFALERGGRELLRGDLARLQMEPDAAPEVELLAPPLSLELAAAPAAFEVTALAVDDHGISAVELVATLASGGGELVEFRERRFPMRAAASSRFARTLDLRELGLGPGAELYVFAEARDVRRPEPRLGRSATHRIRVPGERRPSVPLGAGLPVLQIPELFRSQRQIILDTEKLVAEAERLTPEAFAARSEAIGLDQRALRLRYGALLGEELVSGRPAGDSQDDAAGPSDEEMDEGLAALDESAEVDLERVLPEGLVHEHDAAALNTFFDDEVKARLRAALAEMWDAEGRLRGLAPRRALPHEYRALARLKEAQQRSRAYVEKVGFEPTPLAPERRLTGDLSEIERVRRSYAAEPRAAGLERALAAVGGGMALDWHALDADVAEAIDRLSRRALESDAPGDGLEALSLLERWHRERPTEPPSAERRRVAEALAALLPPPDGRAGAAGGAAGDLWAAYLALLEEGG